MAKIVDIFETILISSETKGVFLNIKKTCVSYFDECSQLLSSFGFEGVLVKILKEYKEKSQIPVKPRKSKKIPREQQSRRRNRPRSPDTLVDPLRKLMLPYPPKTPRKKSSPLFTTADDNKENDIKKANNLLKSPEVKPFNHVPQSYKDLTMDESEVNKSDYFEFDFMT
jgi:hypothetical protein